MTGRSSAAKMTMREAPVTFPKHASHVIFTNVGFL